MMHVELGWRELTNPPATSVPREPAITAPRGFTPPKLRAMNTEATRIQPRVASADVWLAAALVNARAETEVATARAVGLPHSMRLWRESHERALLALARAAAGAPADARCEAITWDQVGGDYHVTASFTSAPLH